MFALYLSLICIVEQNGRRRGIRITLVRSQASGLPHTAAYDNEIAKTADNHRGKIHGSVIGRIYERKISITRYNIMDFFHIG